jgi:spermidine synthase
VLVGLVCAGSPMNPWRLRPRQLLAFGLVFGGFFLTYPSQLPRVGLNAQRGEKLLHLSEGSHGIIAVVEAPGSRRVKLDNYYVLGGTFSTGDERMQAHLPLLLHPAPETVAFLGLGTGITAGGALLHPVAKITAVELVPEVVHVARSYFRDANFGIVGAPRSEVIVNDARNFLRGSGRKFDVIVGDLVVPWRQGEAALYFVEHFQAGRNALAPGGLYCQWLPLFQMSEEEFNIVVASFLDVFPRTTLWRGDFAPNNPALALVGHTSKVALDPARVARRVRELNLDEGNPQLRHPAGLWIYLCGPVNSRSPRFVAARRNRESEPWLELLGPLAHADPAHGSRPLFVGRRLQGFLKEIEAQSMSDSPLERLEPAQMQWRAAGGRLGESMLLLAEGDGNAANANMQEAMAKLPTEVQRAFGVVPAAPLEK